MPDPGQHPTHRPSHDQPPRTETEIKQLDQLRLRGTANAPVDAVTVIEGLGPPHAHDDIHAAPIVDQAPEVQDRHVDAMMTALLVEPDLTDPDVEVTLTTGAVDVCVNVVAEDQPAALGTALAAIRSAAHNASAATPGGRAGRGAGPGGQPRPPGRAGRRTAAIGDPSTADR